MQNNTQPGPTTALIDSWAAGLQAPSRLLTLAAAFPSGRMRLGRAALVVASSAAFLGLAAGNAFAFDYNAKIQSSKIGLQVTANGELALTGTDDEGSGLRLLPAGPAGVAYMYSEGWGVGDADDHPTSASIADFPNRDEIIDGVTAIDFTHDDSSAVAVSSAADAFEVTHAFHPAGQTPNLYRVTVTVKNVADHPVHGVYRRAGDPDLGDFATNHQTLVKSADSDGLSSLKSRLYDHWNPFENETSALTPPLDDVVDDVNAVFDFDLGQLEPGASASFDIWIGADDSKTAALADVAAVGADSYSLISTTSAGDPLTVIYATDGTVTHRAANHAPVAEGAFYAVPNIGPSSLWVEATDQDGDDLDYSLDTDAEHGHVTCDGGAACTYLPDAGYVGPDQFKFTATDTHGASSTATVTLEVQSVTPPEAVASISTDHLAFGTTPAGKPKSATFTIENTGDADLKFYALDPPSVAYTVTGDRSDLAPGDTRTFTVTFKPTSSGVQNGDLVIDTNADGEPLKVALTGTGQKAKLTASRTSIGFGNVSVGATVTMKVSITNTGTYGLSSVKPAITGAGAARYSVSGSTGSLAVGAKRDYTVSYKPIARGSSPAALGFTSTATAAPGAAASPISVSLGGKGIAPVATQSVTTLAFGSGKRGVARAKTFTVKNTGELPLTFGKVVLSGADAARFKLSGSTASLAAGATRTFTVTLTTNRAGSVSASLRLPSNSVPAAPSITLTGSSN